MAVGQQPFDEGQRDDEREQARDEAGVLVQRPGSGVLNSRSLTVASRMETRFAIPHATYGALYLGGFVELEAQVRGCAISDITDSESPQPRHQTGNGQYRPSVAVPPASPLAIERRTCYRSKTT